MKYIFTTIFSLLISFGVCAQNIDHMLQVQNKLDELAVFDSTYLSQIDASVSNIPLSELVRNIAKVNNLSISVKGGDNVMVSCNLSRARVVDLLYFLCRQYNMDLDVVGNIVSIYPYMPPPAEIPAPKVSFDRDSSLLSYDFINIPLSEATRRIADASGVNIIAAQQLMQKRVTGYAVALPTDKAIGVLAESNDMDVFKDNHGLWNLASKAQPDQSQGASMRRRDYGQDQLVIDSLGAITVQIQQGNISDIIRSLCDKLGLNYYFISPVNAQTSLYLKNVELNTLLKVLFTGTPYSYYEEEGIYMFGASKEDVLSAVQVVQMKNRTINRLVEVIPPGLKQGVQIQAFPDLNSVILSGDQRQVSRVEQFIKSIDKTVPLITIEVMIVDSRKNMKRDIGLGLGIGSEPSVTGGSFSPGVDMNLSASAINKMLNSFSGFGSVNLGKVNETFYANLQFLEETGNIELQSTPKLSTLNGHEAELKSGETIFYKEVTQNLMGSQNPVQTSSYLWKPLNADLVIKIVPFVSGNDEITLAIEISQSEFVKVETGKTNTEEADPPPGSLTRSFKSEIRVLNQDMVLLGGIERNDRSNTSTGLPLVARIPVLRWFFGKTHKSNDVNKLNVFIKPTVIY